MRKQAVKTVVAFVLLVAWGCFMFGMSAANGDTSQHFSDRAIAVVMGALDSGFNSLSDVEQLARTTVFSTPVRKLAHFSEYAVFGVLALNFVWQAWHLRRNEFRVALFVAAWVLSVVFASSDEIHQLFVDGRSGQVMDVCIDSAGAALGVVVSYLVCKRRMRA